MSVKNVDKVNAVVVGTERIRTGNDLFLTTKRIVKKCRTGARFLQLFLFFWLVLLLLLLTFCRHLLTGV